MPQDGSNNYYYPPGTPGVPDTTIESEAYNNFLDDLVTNDLNIPRPIHRGGTGATTAAAALTALGGEKNNQVVTNYDSHTWIGGSFYSVPGATNEPLGGATYSGICYVIDANNITVEARNGGTGALFVRQKYQGTWGDWELQPGSQQELEEFFNANYVNLTGDVMSGALTVTPKGSMFGGPSGTLATAAVTPADANIKLYDYGSGNWAGIGTDSNGVMWFRTGFTGTPVPAFYLDTVQKAFFSGNVSVTGTVTASSGATTGTYYFGTNGTKYLTCDGAQYTFVGGGVTVQGPLCAYAPGTPTTGTLFLNSAFTKYLQYDGAKFLFIGGDVAASAFTGTGATFTCGPATVGSLYLRPNGVASATGQTSIASTGDMTIGGATISSGPVYADAVVGSVAVFTQTAAYTFVYYNGSTNRAQYTKASGDFEWLVGNSVVFAIRSNAYIQAFNTTVYKPGGGSWTDSSDARIKNVEGNYTRGLDAVAALNPILYTYKGNDTNEPPANPITLADADTPDPEQDTTPPVVPYPNSPHKSAAQEQTKFTGLIAQEVELVMPELVKKRNAYIDGTAVTDLRDLDTTPLIFAMINCIKELKARVEALENPT